MNTHEEPRAQRGRAARARRMKMAARPRQAARARGAAVRPARRRPASCVKCCFPWRRGSPGWRCGRAAGGRQRARAGGTSAAGGAARGRSRGSAAPPSRGNTGPQCQARRSTAHTLAAPSGCGPLAAALWLRPLAAAPGCGAATSNNRGSRSLQMSGTRHKNIMAHQRKGRDVENASRAAAAETGGTKAPHYGVLPARDGPPRGSASGRARLAAGPDFRCGRRRGRGALGAGHAGRVCVPA